MTTGQKELFGTGITAIYLRSKFLNITCLKNICEGFAIGFDLSQDDGDSLFYFFENSKNLTETIGFGDGSSYGIYEGAISTIINSSFPLESENHRKNLTIAAHALLFAYAINSSIEISDVIKYMGKILVSISIKANEFNPFSTMKDGTIIHPFDSNTIQSLINRDYSLVVKDISKSPRTDEAPLVNYNWHDTNKIMAGPNLQIMKDVENQYYYLSGHLIYENMLGNLPICIEDSTTITTEKGRIDTKYIRNTPCISEDSYIGPPNKVNFYRRFNDGPSSSGDFNSNVKKAFIDFDKSVINKSDWKSNAVQLLSFNTGINGIYIPICNSFSFLDANGRYDLNSEYSESPAPSECAGPTRMHIGDNKPRLKPLYDIHGDCTGTFLSYTTGFKYVSMELDSNDSILSRTYFKTNPESSYSAALTRALNILPNPYLATNENNIYMPFYLDGSLIRWYAGPPQLNGSNSLPTLSFYQTFNNPTFDDKLSIVLYPTISHAGGSTSENTSRSYVISKTPVCSGISETLYSYNFPNKTKVPFVQNVSSNFKVKDETYNLFFGMGDSFSGMFDIYTEECENAGYDYTGYSIKKDNKDIDIFTYVSDYDNYKLGSPIKYIKYIKGYSYLGGQIHMNKMVGQDSSGNRIPYYYFDNRIIDDGTSTVSTSNWSFFAPLPFSLDSKYSRIYETQTVENYLPRYSHGPYSIETRKFLYPNAHEADRVYMGKRNGFPAKVTFNLELREEAVKELYCIHRILPDGRITGPESIHPQRASQNGSIKFCPLMSHIFIPNTSFNNKVYDFNTWDIGSDFFYTSALADTVDINYAPKDYRIENGADISGKHGYTYANNPLSRDNIFIGGRAMTGAKSHKHIIFTGNNSTDFIESYDELEAVAPLYHGYSSTSGVVSLYYIPPIFNISDNRMIVSENIVNAFPVTNPETANHTDMLVSKMDMSVSPMNTGLDPMFFELIGGRRGGRTALLEGGYHSHGLIGDRWMGMISKNFGVESSNCWWKDGLTEPMKIWYRHPEMDQQFLVFNSSSTETTFWANGLSFNPFIQTGITQPFSKTAQFPYKTSKKNGFLTTSYLGIDDMFEFNLSNLLPMKNGTGWYDPTGLILGPFDRDIEIGIRSPNKLIAQSELWFNGQQLTRYQIADRCSYDYTRGIILNTGIVLGEGYRRNNYSVIATIPKGKSGIFNVFSTVYDDWSINPTGVGIETGCYVTIKSYRPLWLSEFDDYIHSGELGSVVPYYLAGANTETKYTIPHSNGFSGLLGTHIVSNYSRSGYTFPLPDETEFKKLGTLDEFGNISYPDEVNVLQYWKKKAASLSQSIVISGWREGTRMSLVVRNLKISYDTMPYESQKIVTPSGNCLISGEMGYFAQADNGIFSEGIHMENITPDDPTVNLYNPQYVSDVLTRIPFFQNPTDSSKSPVLKAPSTMMQRRFPSGIKNGQSYIGVLTNPPFNYNKLLWPALSDLEFMNPGETMEEIPPDDGQTFIVSSLLFSAAQGQQLPNGLFNPNIIKQYGVRGQYQMYDSISTDAIVNSGKCLTSRKGLQNILSQDKMSGALVPLGTTLSMIQMGLV